jgi:hypothetical protein
MKRTLLLLAFSLIGVLAIILVSQWMLTRSVNEEASREWKLLHPLTNTSAEAAIHNLQQIHEIAASNGAVMVNGAWEFPDGKPILTRPPNSKPPPG